MDGIFARIWVRSSKNHTGIEINSDCSSRNLKDVGLCNPSKACGLNSKQDSGESSELWFASLKTDYSLKTASKRLKDILKFLVISTASQVEGIKQRCTTQTIICWYLNLYGDTNSQLFPKKNNIFYNSNTSKSKTIIFLTKILVLFFFGSCIILEVA